MPQEREEPIRSKSHQNKLPYLKATAPTDPTQVNSPITNITTTSSSPYQYIFIAFVVTIVFSMLRSNLTK